ncbi:MAG: phenylalanine--tRNA ligase subunit beta [Fimbriimonadaceae bacterium]|nr:phenylalanine--tRNA ligase subunit beta [Fimbriimonadaceae bacterium]
MKLPVSLLKDYVVTDMSPQELGDLFTMTGFELEEIIEIRGEPVLDINIMANRGDGASIVGLCRELLAKDPTAVATPLLERLFSGYALPDDESRDIWEHATITIETEECSRFGARLFRGITNGESPDWLKRAVELLGQRPISLLVDLTNFVMFETGQPLHAYDYDHLHGHRIIVRQAKEGEKMQTLDEVGRDLDSSMMMICDADRTIGVAGVMGGLDTEVSASTKNCLLEAASFDKQSIRRTRKRLGLHTEASYRFERYVDPEGVVRAINRFAELLQEITGVKSVGGVADVYPSPRTATSIRLDLKRTRTLLGMPVSLDEAATYLTRLGFTVEVNQEEDSLTARAPSWRDDIVRQDDLIEEIGRVHGYEKIPEALPIGSTPLGGPHGQHLWTDQLRAAALRTGLNQIISHSLRKETPLDAPGGLIPLREPGSPEHAFLRNSLMSSLAEAAIRNGGDDVQLFEMGRVFVPKEGSEGLQPYGETRSLAFLITGDLDAPTWKKRGDEADLFAAKGVLESLGIAARRSLRFDKPVTLDPRLHPTRQADLGVGVFGQIHPEVASAMDLPEMTFLAEINLDAWYSSEAIEPTHAALHRHPALRRDISVLVPSTVAYEKLEEAICSTGGDLLESHWLFDVYEGKGVPEGHRSLAIALVFRKDGNFTDEEGNQARDAIVAALAEQGAILR